MLKVDDRVGSKDLVRPLRLTHLPVKLARLPFGDVAFTWRGEGDCPIPVGVEIKTVHDLLDSVLSKRLQSHQLPGLLLRYGVVYLLIEGGMRVSSSGMIEVPYHRGLWRPAFSRMTYSQLDGILTTLEVRAGVRIRRTADRRETAAMIADLYRWGQKPWEEHSSHLAVTQVADLAPDSRITIQPSIVQKLAVQIPGLGPKRALAAARYFRTVEKMANAEPEDWCMVPGVSKITAMKVVQAFRTYHR